MCQLPPTFGDGAGVRFSCTHAFTTTGTTRTISLPFRKIFDVKATYTTNSVANTDGPLSVDNAGGNGWSGGLLTVDTDGTVTVTRPAGTTSGAAFEFSCTGLGL
jgi:hypothetical protein